MKDIWIDATNKEKKVNKKKIVILTIIIVFIVIAIVTIGLYSTNDKAREWIDKNIFRKEVLQDKVATIDLKENQDSNIYAFNKYIGILNKTKFSIYNSTGSQEKTLDLQISNPIWGSANRFLAIAENKGKKVYLISDKDIAWEAEVEGNISQVHVNKNGYVAVVIVDTSYKTVVQLFDSQGNSLFKTILSTTRVVATSISDDNKYLAIAQVDTSGTMVQSNIRIMSIDDSKKNSENAIKKVYSGENNELITNIKYQEKNKLLCMYTDKIELIKADETVETVQEFKDKKISFASIELSNASVTIEEKSSGLFTADSVVNIINSENKSTSLYTAEAVTKEIYTNGNIIALNLGSEVEFINTSGWLVKKYTADQEITSIVVSNSIAGIIYRDKIEIINL